ncbi:hypothetical protein EJB05_47271, partial [Eragrostis curvula]
MAASPFPIAGQVPYFPAPFPFVGAAMIRPGSYGAVPMQFGTTGVLDPVVPAPPAAWFGAGNADASGTFQALMFQVSNNQPNLVEMNLQNSSVGVAVGCKPVNDQPSISSHQIEESRDGSAPGSLLQQPLKFPAPSSNQNGTGRCAESHVRTDDGSASRSTSVSVSASSLKRRSFPKKRPMEVEEVETSQNQNVVTSKQGRSTSVTGMSSRGVESLAPADNVAKNGIVLPTATTEQTDDEDDECLGLNDGEELVQADDEAELNELGIQDAEDEWSDADDVSDNEELDQLNTMPNVELPELNADEDHVSSDHDSGTEEIWNGVRHQSDDLVDLDYEIHPSSLGDCGCAPGNSTYKERKPWPKRVVPPDCRMPRTMGAIEKAA